MQTLASLWIGFLLLGQVAHADVLIGVINLQKIMTTIKEGSAVNEKLKKTFDDRKATLKKEEDKIKKDQEEYMKQSALLSTESRNKKEMELQQSIAGLQKKTMEYQKEIADLEASLKKPLLEKVRTIIEQISVDQKVDLTVEISSSPVVYAKSKKDLTDLIIAAYDKKYPKK